MRWWVRYVGGEVEGEVWVEVIQIFIMFYNIDQILYNR